MNVPRRDATRFLAQATVDRVANEIAQEMLIMLMLYANCDRAGRLPGNPDVLRAWLFQPNAPPPDITTNVVERVVRRMAEMDPPIVHWYVADSKAVVQIISCDKPGARSLFPSLRCQGAKMIAQSVLKQQPLFGEKKHRLSEIPKEDVDALIRSLARMKAMSICDEYDGHRVSTWAREHGTEVGDAARFGRWLYQTGVTDMEAVLHLLDHSYAMKPTQPFAYYAPGGQAREMLLNQFNARRVEAEHAQYKAKR